MIKFYYQPEYNNVLLNSLTPVLASDSQTDINNLMEMITSVFWILYVVLLVVMGVMVIWQVVKNALSKKTAEQAQINSKRLKQTMYWAIAVACLPVIFPVVYYVIGLIATSVSGDQVELPPIFG